MYPGHSFSNGIDMQPRHPAQLYEAIAYFILFLVMMFLYKNYSKKLHRGFFFGLCLTAIFTFRFFVEFLKENRWISKIAWH